MSAPESPGSSAPSKNLNSVALRFIGSLLLLGGVTLIVIALTIRQFPTAMQDGGLIYVLPGGGSRHGIEPLGTMVLIAAGGLLGFLGTAGLVVGRVTAGQTAKRRAVVPVMRRTPRASRPVRTLIVGATALAAVLILRWLSLSPS